MSKKSAFEFKSLVNAVTTHPEFIGCALVVVIVAVELAKA